MKKLYGKDVNMQSINRNPVTVQRLIEDCRKTSKQYLNKYEEKADLSCRICAGTDLQPFIQVHSGYHYMICGKCESIVLANLPHVEQLYRDDNLVNDIYIDEEIFLKRVEMIAKPKYKFVKDILQEHNIKIDTWLDIGCGTGELLSAIKEDGNVKVIGIESDPREVQFAREKNDLTVIEGFVDPNNSSPKIIQEIKRASVISFINVLEHIEKPNDFIAFLNENMTPGSILVFEVPRHPSLASFANLTSQDNIYRHIIPPIHLQVFSEKAIEVLINNNYQLLATWGFGQGFFDLLTNAMLISGTNNTGLFEQLLEKNNQIQRAIDESGFSDQMLFVYQKISIEESKEKI